MANRPGGELSKRPLHLLLVCDTSGSMQANGKLAALNTAVREALPHLKQVAGENPGAEVLIRILEFNTAPRWQSPSPIPLDTFVWRDFKNATGETRLGAALHEVAVAVKIPPMYETGCPPVILLISDGQPTDDYAAGLKELNDLPWGKKSVRQAIAIGADADKECLREFLGSAESEVLEAHNAEQLVKAVHWAGTIAVRAASAPASQVRGVVPTGAVNIPKPPANLTGPATGADPW